MFNNENYIITTSNSGPVQISPQSKHDIIWIAQKELLNLPHCLSDIKSSCKDNQLLPDSIWSYFPHIYSANLSFIDERADHSQSYSEAKELANKGKISRFNPFMSSSDSCCINNNAHVNVNIHTRPTFTRYSRHLKKWDEIDTILSIEGIRHEFSHGIQTILSDIVSQSLSINDPWNHHWVQPKFLIEGYALVQSGSRVLLLANHEIVSQPWIFEALTLGQLVASDFQVNNTDFSYIFDLSQIETQRYQYHDYKTLWKHYIINYWCYLSLIGLRVGLNPENLIELINTNQGFSGNLDQIFGLKIIEKKALLQYLYPTLITTESNRIELESQIFYYLQSPVEFEEACQDVYNASQNCQEIPSSTQALNHQLLTTLLQGKTLDELLKYLNKFIKISLIAASKSKYVKALNPLSPTTNPSPISIHSRSEENPFDEIIKRKLNLDN